ncbi:hypothetical protein ACHAXT_004959 [Thalassiosira profunda]
MNSSTTRRTRRQLNGLAAGRRCAYNVLILLLVLSLGAVGANADSLFDAIDANHDHSISEAEYTAAVGKLLGAGGGGAAAGGASANNVGAPPLGLDSNPFTYHHDPSASTGVSLHEKLKFHDPGSGKDFFKGLFASFSAIIATEIGDKTFFIAAVLSMRNDRAAVFGGAILALIIMTILSTAMGLVLPALMPKKYTHIIGGILFLYFGVKLLADSRGMEDKVSEELEEVEEELAEMNKKKSRAKKKKRAEAADDEDVEGQVVENGDGEGAKKRRGGGSKALKHAPSSVLSAAGDYSGSSWEAVFLQALSMTFLAEWGDRSQIATIALAAAKDPIGVTIGGCIGHSICTGMAVIGGRMLASRISEKSVAFYGGLVFLAFGIHSVFFEE